MKKKIQVLAASLVTLGSVTMPLVANETQEHLESQIEETTQNIESSETTVDTTDEATQDDEESTLSEVEIGGEEITPEPAAERATSLGAINTVFGNKAVAQAVAAKLGKAESDTVTVEEITAITVISIDNSIGELTGIEKLTGLTKLTLMGKPGDIRATSIAFVKQMPKLDTFRIYSTLDLTNINDLKNSNVSDIYMNDVRTITDFSAVQQMPKLKKLDIAYLNDKNVDYATLNNSTITVLTIEARADLAKMPALKNTITELTLTNSDKGSFADANYVSNTTYLKEMSALKQLHILSTFKGKDISWMNNLAMMTNGTNYNGLTLSNADIADVTMFNGVPKTVELSIGSRFDYNVAKNGSTVTIPAIYKDFDGSTPAITKSTGGNGASYVGTNIEWTNVTDRYVSANIAGNQNEITNSKKAFKVTVNVDTKEGTVTPPVSETGKVFVHHVDETGKTVAQSETLTGKVGTTYMTKAATISGYKLQTTPNNAKGTFTKADVSVTYVYSKIPAVEEGTVTVKYVDINGAEIAPSIVLTGKVGTAYTTDAATVKRYILKTTPANANGVYTKQAIEVTYTYEKEVLKPTDVITIADYFAPEVTPHIVNALGGATTSTVENLETITALDDAIVGLTSLEGFDLLPNLMSLSIEESRLTNLNALQTLTQLQYLAVTESDVTDLSFVSALTNLSEVDFSDNLITDVTPLTTLPNLTTANLDWNVIGDVTPLSGMSSLHVSLNVNRIYDVSALATVAGFSAQGQVLISTGETFGGESTLHYLTSLPINAQGQAIAPAAISHNGVFNAEKNQVEFTGLTATDSPAFTFASGGAGAPVLLSDEALNEFGNINRAGVQITNVATGEETFSGTMIIVFAAQQDDQGTNGQDSTQGEKQLPKTGEPTMVNLAIGFLALSGSIPLILRKRK